VKKIAFLFPGQGSQTVGMGQEFFQEYDAVKDIFNMASEITQLNLRKLCFEGPMEELTQTVNLQPAMTAVNLACLAVLEAKGMTPHFAAGHSLGEYAALHAAGVLSKEDTLRLVFKRGQLMHREATRYIGAMSAVIGLNIERVQELVLEAQKAGIVSVANHNTETQIVITGSPEGVKQAAFLASAEGAKAIPLKVSGAWHSELIKGAEAEFSEFIEGIEFNQPKIPVIFNVTAGPINAPAEIKDIMAAQLVSPVRWYDAMRRLMDEKVEMFVEVGPGRVLSGLLKRIAPKNDSYHVFNVQNRQTLNSCVEAILT
jgi:[acyl-carrier-protein] S-malonyltransferase